MKVKISIIAMIIFILMTSCITVYAGANSVTLETTKTLVKAGESFTVKIKAVSPDGINGLVTKFGYDTEKLELVSKKVADTNFTDLGGAAQEVTLMFNPSDLSNFQKVTDSNVYELVFKVKEGVAANSVATITLSNTHMSTFSLTNSDMSLPGDELEITVVPETSAPGDEPGNEPGDEPGDEPSDECKHDKGTSFVDNKDGTHSTVCEECEKTINKEKHTYENGTCTKCKAKQKDDTVADGDINYAGIEDYAGILVLAVATIIGLYIKNTQYKDI